VPTAPPTGPIRDCSEIFQAFKSLKLKKSICHVNDRDWWLDENCSVDENWLDENGSHSKSG